jgi:hypothetical protein
LSTSIDTKQQILDRHILPAMGRRRLDSVDSLMLDRFVANGLRTLSAKTVANHLAVVSKMLQRAKRRGWLRELPRMPRA